jgi:hypothetical protein
MQKKESEIDRMLFGDVDEVAWWDRERSPSIIREGEVAVRISPRELWENCDKAAVRHQPVFFNGILWCMPIAFEKSRAGGYELAVYFEHSRDTAPVAVTAFFQLVGVARKDTIMKLLDRDVVWMGGSWGVNNMLGGTTFTSLEDATAKLARYIHADGCLHFNGVITKVH